MRKTERFHLGCVCVCEMVLGAAWWVGGWVVVVVVVMCDGSGCLLTPTPNLGGLCMFV